MTTRRRFIQALPAAGAAFAVGCNVASETPAVAKEAAPLEEHFHPKGKTPSEFTKAILKKAVDTLPFADKRDFAEKDKGFIARKLASVD